MTEVARSLANTLLDLTRIPSPIGEERALCDHVEARLADSLGADAITRHCHSLVVQVAPAEQGQPHIGLAGHLDTVRTEHDGEPRIDGNRLYGAGAADMKSGLAVMVELAERLDRAALPYGLTLIFYEGEEGPYAENRLGELLAPPPGTDTNVVAALQGLHELDLAVCLEPSDNELQLGALGTIHATVTFEGRTAHSARPWQGDNALYKCAAFLRQLEAREPVDVNLDGHLFREVMTPTLLQGGRARNVVPGLAELNVNYRFAPGKTGQQAVDELTAFVGEAGTVTPIDVAPAGRPHADNALVKHLAASGVTAVRTKQAWTDVARFDAIGVPGANLGPGNSAQAHQRNEYTELPLIESGYEIFARFLGTRSDL